MSKQLLLGNDAIGLALVEQDCRVVTGYPGTPSSEILAGVIKYKQQHDRQIYTEWSTNEKVALEVALAATWVGLRAAVTMKQVGLNVASDPLFSAAYQGVKGGFLVIAADDPGLHSSQTEQDSRLLALTAKVPVFDPSSPEEARAMVGHALSLSERYALPVMLRPTTRICHALQSMALNGLEPQRSISKERFRKEPERWAATPKFRFYQKRELNQKLLEIEKEFDLSPLNYVVDADAAARVGVITSGAAFHTTRQVLEQLGVRLPVLKIGTPYPLPRTRVSAFMAGLDAVIVVEETDVCIELQMPASQTTVHGRRDGAIPGAGELTPDVLFAALKETLNRLGVPTQAPPEDALLAETVQALPLPMRRPRLCPGCGHRSAFFAMKRTFGPKAIYPGDIGCYTLGSNLRAVDTLVDMGASVSMAHGFYHANRITGDSRPVIATIGDSTFLHSGIVPLLNAVHTGARFVLVILDNHTTAMTGFQPTMANDRLADGSDAAHSVSLAGMARACGVKFVVEADPYQQESFGALLQQAYDFSQSEQGGVAVIVADHPCVLYDNSPILEHPVPVLITEECDGCRYCVEAFECPALSLAPDRSRVNIDYKICVNCGQCIDACFKGFIVPDYQKVIS
ncbi:MAG: indolepyruvate oxidoreductase [Caldilineales bacterium]|nr:indolepyruvate oxidoreductase [Caldilineales bacterium]